MVSASRPGSPPVETNRGRKKESISDAALQWLSQLAASRYRRWAQESPSISANKPGKARCPVLCSLDQMPDWFQRGANPYILSGYRDISGSYSIRSLGYLHNESVNIYSHLIPAILFLLGAWYIQPYLASRYPEADDADFTVFFIFVMSAVTCFSLSAMYHTFMIHSQHVEHLCLRLDMLGVVIFILGDLVTEIYIVFWCEPKLRNIYWSMVSKFPSV